MSKREREDAMEPRSGRGGGWGEHQTQRYFVFRERKLRKEGRRSAPLVTAVGERARI